MQRLINHFRSLKYKKYNPILITDIDGVLVRGSNPISTTLQALYKIKQHNIPFACLTNGGGQLQSNKSYKLNKIFGFNQQQTIWFNKNNMFMNHTPLKPQLINHSQKGQFILVTGSLQIQQILHDLNINNYITCDQFYTLFHQHDHELTQNYKILPCQPHSSFKSRQLTVQQVINQIKSRTHKNIIIPQTFNQWINKISAIFAMNDVSPYETALQVIHNVLSHKRRYNQPLPPYFASQNDIIWASQYKRPRMAFGPFNYILKAHCEKYDFNLQQIHFGKPQLKAFKFVQKIMRQKIFFMVGDNPKADIKGANTAGWGSFLTQTGIHHGKSNDTNNPATLVVQDFRQAVNLIIQLKKQLTKLKYE